ncbi:MAG: hypothetical protein JOY53_18070 [Acidobacteriaceae bacterium]|nr:hypothetical protein [Acidobacteriaceae bacterium]
MASLSGVVLFAQDGSSLRRIDPSELHVLSDQSAREALAGKSKLGGARTRLAPAGGSLPLWTYQVRAAQDGQTYTGMIVGTSPTGKQTTTTVPAILVPVILKITQGGVTYIFDPTTADPSCLGSGHSALGLTQSSPLFQNANFTFNGVNVGNTQYSDAMLRGEFWKYIKSSSSAYHLHLSLTTKSALTISVNAGGSGNSTAAVYNLGGGYCGSNTHTNQAGLLGIVDIDTIDNALGNYISANGLNAGQFPFFVIYNSVMSEGSADNLNNCCILGYHNALGNPGQTYGIADFEGRDQTVFSGVSDVAAASHEVNEWVNDPSGGNPTPSWGNIGQVSGCQNNFEVGDPLSGTLFPSVYLNGFTYHLQELAYFSWFYGGASLGAGGKYSDNGTFTGDANLCPPGGTN